MNSDIKNRINALRNILVGKVPNPMEQVNQITNALLYKFMDDQDLQAEKLGGKKTFFIGELEKYAWHKIVNDSKTTNEDKADLYEQGLRTLSKNKDLPKLFRDIFKDAFLPFRGADTIVMFLNEVNKFDYNENPEVIASAFEYILSILGSQGDAGQFRTPYHIIKFIVDVVDPRKTDSILDPACGTAGFLVEAFRHIKEQGLSNKEAQELSKRIQGIDLAPEMAKFARVNLYLHGFKNPHIKDDDTLTNESIWDNKHDIILANPPFMTPKGGIKPHDKFGVKANRSEVLFVDYIMENLKVQGRAGVIVPEGIIFKSENAYKKLRKMLVEDGLFAVVSLPSGIFQPYSGVKTSILFFDNKRSKETENILFIKVENDGFDLGAQRRPIDKNDLPKALELIKKYQEVADKKKEHIAAGDMQKVDAVLVRRQEILDTDDYNLSIEKYRIDPKEKLQKILGNIKLPDFVDIQKIADVHKKEAEKIQKALQPAMSQIQTFINSPSFQLLSKTIQDLTKQQGELVKGLKIKELQEVREKLQKELKAQEKWPMVGLGEVLKYEQPTNYIVNSVDYSDEYKIPVLTAGKTFVLGYTNEPDGVFPKEKLPVIIFDDFTTAIKFVDFPFKVKSSAMKILHPVLDIVNPAFIFYLMKNIKFNAFDHKRYWISEYSKIKIPLPPLEVQKQIVAEIEGYQKVIDGAKQVIENWKPTIKPNPDWPMVELRDVCEIKRGAIITKKQAKEGCIPVIAGGKHPAYFHNKSNRKGPVITVSASGAYAGFINFFEQDIYASDCSTIQPIDSKKMDIRFIYRFLKTKQPDIYNLQQGGGQPHVYPKDIQKMKIPLPPLEVQKRIVAEIEAEQKIVNQNKKLIEIFEEKIKRKISEIWGE